MAMYYQPDYGWTDPEEWNYPPAQPATEQGWNPPAARPESTQTGGLSLDVSDFISKMQGGLSGGDQTKERPQIDNGRTTWTVPSRLTGTKQISSWAPSGAAPTMAAIPEFELPEWEEEEVAGLRQKYAAPGVRRLRGAVQTAMGQTYESPQIKRMTLRQALAGYGMGLESVMGGAGREARAEYGEEYGREVQAEQMQWQANVQRLAQMYQGAMQAHLRGGTTTSTTAYQYGGTSGTGVGAGERQSFIDPQTGQVKLRPRGYV